MKFKILAIIAILIIAMCSIPVCAEDYDVTGMRYIKIMDMNTGEPVEIYLHEFTQCIVDTGFINIFGKHYIDNYDFNLDLEHSTTIWNADVDYPIELSNFNICDINGNLYFAKNTDFNLVSSSPTPTPEPTPFPEPTILDKPINEYTTVEMLLLMSCFIQFVNLLKSTFVSRGLK